MSEGDVVLWGLGGIVTASCILPAAAVRAAMRPDKFNSSPGLIWSMPGLISVMIGLLWPPFFLITFLHLVVSLVVFTIISEIDERRRG